MSKHLSSHRRARRRSRAGILAVALGVTILVGGTAAGVLPQLTGGDPASGAAGSLPVTLQTAALAPLDVPARGPAKAAEKTKKRTATESLTSVAALPKGSGSGRRIVFDQGEQRVWLVGGDDAVERTYRVSGSRFDNLGPGTYSVQSKSRTAGAFDGSGTMEYFVRFATGYSAPIGFHSVPVDNAGQIEQTKAQLGTPLSAGCVRQWMPDAAALWDFAPVGTTVVVTA